MRLSEHFTLRELTRSATAERRGIDNTPGEEEIENLVRLCENVLEPVRKHYGIPFSPSSGYRCLELNRAIGSKDTSQHIEGNAVDFELPGISNYKLARWIRDNLDFDQLILEFYYPEDGPDSGWIHCSYAGDGNRNEVLTINRKGRFSGLLKPINPKDGGSTVHERKCHD